MFIIFRTRSLKKRIYNLKCLEKMLEENENSILNALEKDMGAVKNFHYITELSILYVYYFIYLL